jgi:hypothetical protein
MAHRYIARSLWIVLGILLLLFVLSILTFTGVEAS